MRKIQYTILGSVTDVHGFVLHTIKKVPTKSKTNKNVIYLSYVRAMLLFPYAGCIKRFLLSVKLSKIKCVQLY